VTSAGAPQPVDRAFGAENRARLLREYFNGPGTEAMSTASAWKHCYRLLLWIDRTIGLAHCYESDKCQPGRPWYERSLRFHQWLSYALDVAPRDLATALDWLFVAASADLARAAQRRRSILAERATEQHAAFEALPLPGDDPELDALIADTLRSEAGVEIPPTAQRELRERMRAQLSAENKRKNLLGEGFEDTLGEILHRTPGVESRYLISVRPLLHDLPGFYPPRGTDKPRQVDLALTPRHGGSRVLVSCKWSVRSDREEQFVTDFEAYSRLEASGEDFNYVLLTNEFDPARLAAACDARRPNGSQFTSVVHINPDGVLAAYGNQDRRLQRARADGMARATAHIYSGRLMSLQTWLESLEAGD
jgi:hypothetical protein